MKVVLDQAANSSIDVATLASHKASAPRATTHADTPPPAEEVSRGSQKESVVANTLQANVTFRRDPKGQIYYVVTDAQSGKELRQVPAEAVRKVGEGIDEYLKQQEAKPNSHIEVKA